MSPEARLVLQADGHETVSGEVQDLLDGTLDWRRVLAIADHERAMLPLWRTIKASGRADSSLELTALKEIASVWEFRLRRLEQLLLGTLRVLDDHGIHPLLLKGSAAALCFHGGFTGRPMIDVDLLIPEEDSETAWALAQTVGWEWDADAYPRDSYGEAHHLPPLDDASGSGMSVEIHRQLWMPDHPFAFAESDFVAASRRLAWQGMHVQVPSPEHQLLHCCIHFAWSHRIRGHAWRAFHDVGAIVSSGRLDWPAFLELAAASRAGAACYWTLRLTQTAVDIDLPVGALPRLTPRLPRFVLDRLERHFLMNLLPFEARCPSLAMERRLWGLALGNEASRGISLPSDRAPQSLTRRIRNHTLGIQEWLRYMARLR